uniref:RRM domain-containing protein n=2 Tax=Graphocephala atropunctata TaxID=36148 RepID=A0A1B6MIV0_9HEMI
MENSRDSNWKNNNSGGGGERRRWNEKENNSSRGGGDGYDSNARRPPPELVPVIVPSETKKPVKDVLIGNLPVTMTQGDVYKLCTRAKIYPLHIEMRTIHRPPVPVISYAQVFVPTETEAKDLTEALNKLVVNEHQLVVGFKDNFAEKGKKLA